MTAAQHLRRARIWFVVMAAGLVVAGVTAFPLVWEARVLDRLLHRWPAAPGFAVAWIDRVCAGIAATGRDYPFMAYGTDWLAYAHLMIAALFLMALRDPVRNRLVVEFGLVACLSVIPVALIAGPVRGIPLWWTCIDMSFGIVGLVPLVIARRHIRAIESP